MASLVQSGKYGAINITDTTTNGFYVIKLISKACKLKNNTTIDGKIISAVLLVVKSQYLCSMKENYNWYWKQQSLQQNIVVPTRTIIHPYLDVARITYVQDIPKTVCSSFQSKKPYDGLQYSLCNKSSV